MATSRTKKDSAKKAESKDIVVAGLGDVASASAPEFMQKGKQGLEALGRDDIEMAWIKLIQATTPGLQQNDWTPGNFVHSITGTQITGKGEGKESAEKGFFMTPVLILPPRYMLFNPIDQGGGILARAEDGVNWSPANADFKVKIYKGSKEVTWSTKPTVQESGLANFGTFDPDDPKSLPAADLQYRYVCYIHGHPEWGPVVIMMQKSAIKAAKRINAILDGSGYPSYSHIIHLDSRWEEKSGDDKKFVWVPTASGFVNDEELYKSFVSLHERYADEEIVMHDEDKAGEQEFDKKAPVDAENAEY